MHRNYVSVHRMQPHVFIQASFLPFFPPKIPKTLGHLNYKIVHMPSIKGSQMAISTLVLTKTMSTEFWGLVHLLLSSLGHKMQIKSPQLYVGFRTDSFNYTELNFQEKFGDRQINNHELKQALKHTRLICILCLYSDSK